MTTMRSSPPRSISAAARKVAPFWNAGHHAVGAFAAGPTGSMKVVGNHFGLFDSERVNLSGFYGNHSVLVLQRARDS